MIGARSKDDDGSSQSVATLCGLTAEESMAIVGAGCLRAGAKEMLSRRAL
jgi:hypothetical protein